ncbi:MAG: DNA repair protein RecN [Dehalococcoidia bacterium]|nr:DNA repair protein RecN [Dehalococcoidia bacterium]
MLGELHIRNFAVIKDMSVSFIPGLNVVSGEEGSGKSLLVDAMSLLMGARAPAGLVRSGTASARIEAIFWPAGATVERVNSILDDNGIEPEANGMLLISRDFQDGGRSVARINNRAVPLSLLKQLGRHLVDIHGQMDYLSLLDPANQLDLVDAYGNLLDLRRDLRKTVEDLRAREKELASMNGVEKEGYAELLQYQIEEIGGAGLDEIDEEQMLQERDILRRAEAICGGCLESYATLYGDERSVSVMLHKTLASLRSISSIDSSLSAFLERLENDLAGIEETARDLKDHASKIENSQERLEEIERRIEDLSMLKRKYGNTIEDIIAFSSKAEAELDALQDGQARRARLESEQQNLKNEAARSAEALSLARRESAEQLISLVNEELADIRLEWAKFDIVLSRREAADGLAVSGGKSYVYTSDGIDRVEFQVATNPGEPMRSMAAIASGGEASRIILAIKSALKVADPIPTLVFDEIDMGVGGRSAESVGRKLATLSSFHQVLCITHLPQIACFGDSHFKLVKEIDAGRACTRVEIVDGQNRLKELAAMLGSERNSGVMLKGAEALLKNAERWKSGARELVAA